MVQASRGYIGIKKEAEWGIHAGGANDLFLPFVSESLTQNIEEVMSAIQRGTLDEPISYQGEKSFVGDVVVEVHPRSIGHILRSAMGIPDPTGTKADTAETQFCACDVIWTAVDEAVIPSLDSTIKKEGTHSSKIQVSKAGTLGVLASQVIEFNFKAPATTHYKFWFRSSIPLAPDQLAFVVSENALGAETPEPFDTVNITTTIEADKWYELTIEQTNAANVETGISVAIKMLVEQDEFTFWIDDIRAVVAGVADVTLQHVFKPMQTVGDEFNPDCPLYPYTLDVFRDQGAPFRYLGAVVNTLALNFSSTDKILKATCGIIAAKIDDGAANGLSLEPTNPFVWSNATITISAKGTVPAVGAMNDIESFSLTFDNVCAAKYALNHTDLPRKIIRTGVRTIPVSFTIEFLNRDEYANFISGTERSFTIKFVGVKPTDETKEAFYTLQIDLPSVRYLSYPINIGGPGPITCAVTGKAKYYAAADYNYPLMITLHNLEDNAEYAKAPA